MNVTRVPLTRIAAPASFRFEATPPLTLYVHIPWCARKCPYCDFNSHESAAALPEQAYLTALMADLEQELPDIWGRRVESIFIGGGTPSLFAPASIDRLLSDVRARLSLLSDAEITLEANPGTVDPGRLREFRAAGVNRLSLGAQSFDNALLARIGRIHGRTEILSAAEGIAAAGFDNWNLDLMYGLPGQSPAQALADVRQAMALGPTHLSHYQLTLEPNTAFYHSPPTLPDDDTAWEMQRQCQAELAAQGYVQYETSAYAREGRRCRHNLNYWRFGDYLGIGAGAHGKLTHAPTQTIRRSAKVKHPRAYLDAAMGAARVGTRQELDPAQTGLEFMMNALRLNEGFPVELFQAHAGLPLAIVEGPLARAEQLGLIERDAYTIRPSERGRRYLNELLTLFVPDEG
ncbi:MAG: oxygen-independent coproporphyrinogen III oxidase-like protein [Gammaproteobacteria bacterium]|nr:oxygen-independent coproporphyrinogen III oxidase-like protein [Gammaproteobacteria bacterium]